MICSHFCTYDSKIEAILQSDPMQVNDREGSGQPRVAWGQIIELVSLNEKCMFFNEFDFRNAKISFLFLFEV